MKNRLIILASVLLALAALYIVGLFLYRPSPQEMRVAFPDVENPESIAVDGPNGVFIGMERQNQGWRVTGNGPVHPARSERVDGFLAAVKDSRVGRLVGSGDDVLGELSLTDAAAYYLTIQESGRTIEALFGEAGTTPQTLYYRTPASTEAYLLESSVRFYLTQRPSYWSDLRVFFGSVAADSVVRLDFDGLGGDPRLDYTVFQTGEEWVFEDRENIADQNRVASLVRTASTVEATGFIPYQGDVEWTRVLRIHLDDGRVFSLYADDSEPEPRIMAEGPGLPADENGFPYHYRIGGATLGRILAQAEDLTAAQ